MTDSPIKNCRAWSAGMVSPEFESLLLILYEKQKPEIRILGFLPQNQIVRTSYKVRLMALTIDKQRVSNK